MKTDGSISAKVTMANTPSLAHNTGRRLGTAVNEARIIPVEYSAVIVSTASTATGRTEMLTPAVAIESRLWVRSNRSPGDMLFQWDFVTSAISEGMPIVSRTATPSVHIVA